MLKIQSLDCELAAYRKGFLAVHIDLARGYLTWRESNRWYNNFTRTLSPELLEWLNSILPGVALIQGLPLHDSTCQIPADRLLPNDQPPESRSPFNPPTDIIPQTGPAMPTSQHRLAWSIMAQTSDGCFEASGLDSLPVGWGQLTQMIETVSRLPFCL